MKKILAAGLLLLAALAGAGVYYLVTNLDALVESAIETHGSAAARTRVKVGGVRIDLKEGASTIRGLTVANPEGFEAPLAFSLDELTVEVATDSLTEDVIVIDRIVVRDPEVFFELREDGRSNLEEIEQGLGGGGGGGAKASGEGGGPGPRLIIRKLLFEGGRIEANLLPLKRQEELKLPRIVMTDLGGKRGATPEGIARQILGTLTRRASAEVQKKALGRAADSLRREAGKALQGLLGR
ncbi:MAG: hypothetical protein P1V51_22965 [Deltaproteobacteria bacterium]|nr:hypothetical protein [Deltaproteobacteria bacterium]